jgi:chromosome segregation ATPase
MTLDNRVSRIPPALGRLERPVDTDPTLLAHELAHITQLIRQPEPDPRGPLRGRDTSQFDAALDMVKHAAEALEIMESRSQQIQAQAQAVAERARLEIRAASQEVASLQERLSTSEARAENLEATLIEAEEDVQRANEWLTRFQDTITTAFSSRRSQSPRAVAA